MSIRKIDAQSQERLAALELLYRQLIRVEAKKPQSINGVLGFKQQVADVVGQMKQLRRKLHYSTKADNTWLNDIAYGEDNNIPGGAI